MALTPAGNQVNLLAPSPTSTTGKRGLPRFHAGDEVPYTKARDSFARKLEEAQVVPFHQPHHQRQTGRNNTTKPTAYSYRRQWNPCHMDFWSCSSKPLTGRTGQVEGRFSYWNYTGDISTAWYTGILHRTRTRRKTTCLVGTPPLRLLLLLLRKDDKPIRKLAQRHLAGDDRLRIASLRIAPGHSRLQSSRLPTTDINHRLLGKTNQKGTHLRPIPFGNQSFVSTAYDSCTPQYSRWFNIDAKPLATTTMSAGILQDVRSTLMSLLFLSTCLPIVRRLEP